ncbi:MAG: protein kinase [Pyrinomonadaceae bacterium]|nr:protein kinase [Phycisphaerales bacterium]
MPKDNPRLVEEIFVEAAGAPPDARRALLDARCKGDKELRQEVESLLSAHEAATGVLDIPQPLTQGLMKQISGLMHTDDAAVPASGKIGAYIVHKVLGSGGMGVVYLAEQERPRRTVALKVIRRGLATPSLLRRFEHEAEILGRLQHPGIAQIYEAGVADYGYGPQPFIAMEYIDGRPLLDFADANRLGTRERLALVARTCDALQHAHQRGVIHRDLKPANILVRNEDTTVPGTKAGQRPDTGRLSLMTGVGEPKILDFGVARIADGRQHATTLRTSVGQLIGTLAYMSPEQLGLDTNDVDTRSDVYSLGVVLYQLLTGKLPYDVSSRALPEAVRMIKDDQPTKLSQINKTFRGDLDTIVSKALEKDKNRRYQSAAELGADILRFLAGEPIAAKRDSSMYFLRKQIVRYRGIVAAATVAVLTFLAFAINAIVSEAEYKAIAAAEIDANRDAQQARAKVAELNVSLNQELYASNVDRGRLLGATGNVAIAEDFIWTEYFRTPSSRQAWWALWEMYNRTPCLWTVQLPCDAVSATVSADSGVIAVGGKDLTLRFYEALSGSRLPTHHEFSSYPRALAFSPDGNRVAVGSLGGGVRIVNVSESEGESYSLYPRRVHVGGTLAVAWSPDGNYIATGGGDRMICLWDAHSATPLARWKAHEATVSCMAFSSDSKQLASGSYEAGEAARIRVWSVPDATLTHEVEVEGYGVTAIAFTPDNLSVTFGNNGRSAIVAPINGAESRIVGERFASDCTIISYIPGGRGLFIGAGPTAKMWSPQGERAIFTFAQHRDNIMGGGWTGRARAVTVSEDGAIKGWDVRGAPSMKGGYGQFGSWCFGTEYSPDGAWLAIGSGDGTVVIADAVTRKRTHVVQIGPKVRTRVVHWLSGGRLLLTGSDDGIMRIIDPVNGQVVDSLGARGAEIMSIAIHPGHATIAVGHADRTVRIWDLPSRTKMQDLTGFTERVEGAAFSPDGKLLAVSGLARGVQLWDVATWKPLSVLAGLSQAWAVAFSPDGSMVAAGTWGDNIELWDVSSHNRIASLTGHRGLLSTIAFSPDGTYLASGGDDATVKLWDVASRRCMLTLETAHGESTGLSFDPTGRYLTSGCQSKMTLTWDLEAIKPHINGNLRYNRGRYDKKMAETP